MKSHPRELHKRERVTEPGVPRQILRDGHRQSDKRIRQRRTPGGYSPTLCRKSESVMSITLPVVFMTD